MIVKLAFHCYFHQIPQERGWGRRDPDRLGFLLNDVYYESSASPHRSAFIFSLRHTSVEGRVSRAGEWSSGKLGCLYIPAGKETHFLFYCFKHVCRTGGGNGRCTHGGQEGRACGLGPVSAAAPEETQPGAQNWCKWGPGWPCFLGGAWPVGCGSCDVLFGLPNLSRVPHLCEQR